MPKKILIIEDEEYLAQMYRFKLDKEGYQVEYALDGKTGIEAAKKLKPDLILLDIVMPEMDGFQALEGLRKMPECEKTQIYFFSNLGQAEEIERGMSQGIDGYIVKASVTPSELVDKIDDILKHPRKAAIEKQAETKADLTHECKPANGKKVLIIEDQSDIAQMYALKFKKEGFAVVNADNGAWGLKLANEEKFDAIILDIVMPALNGIKALKKIRENSANRDSLIIVISNSGQENDISEAKASGADYYFIKAQLTPVKLVKKVIAFLDL